MAEGNKHICVSLFVECVCAYICVMRWRYICIQALMQMHQSWKRGRCLMQKRRACVYMLYWYAPCKVRVYAAIVQLCVTVHKEAAERERECVRVRHTDKVPCVDHQSRWPPVRTHVERRVRLDGATDARRCVVTMHWGAYLQLSARSRAGRQHAAVAAGRREARQGAAPGERAEL